MAKLKISKKILFILFLIFTLWYIYRGVTVSISNNTNQIIKNIELQYSKQKDYLDDIEIFRAKVKRIRVKKETSLQLFYEIEHKGCFRVDVDTYIEPGFVGQIHIMITDNKRIDYRERIYLTFFQPLFYLKSWRQKILYSKKVFCKK